MSKAKETIPQARKPVDADQAAQVAGGDGDCTSTVSVGGIKSPTETFGDAAIQTYEGAIDATSHIMERVVKAF
jgi:hypothetical protein